MSGQAELSYDRISDITKSPNDLKQYLSLKFASGLKVLLASDVKSKKCSASMSVGVGSMNDPEELPGLAHLCEHMLFFESASGKPKSYQGYASLIAEHGGSSNAFTARDQTNYYFDISPSALKGALERFAKFFTCPPEFNEEALEKEIETVQSEFAMKLNNDAWRRSAVDASCCREHHPYQKFTTGNKTTLQDVPKQKSINVLKELCTFHRTIYSASVMSLVVVGNQCLEYLEDLVVSLFANTPSNNLKLPVWRDCPFGSNDCGIQIDILSVADVRDLYVCFPIPDTRPVYKTFPQGYITRLLAHKGKGSLFSKLSKNNLVNNQFINSTIPARGFGLLSLGLQLTVDGLQKIDEILSLIFQYIKMMRQEPKRYFWEEMKQILHNDFTFQDQETAFEFSQRTSNLLHVYPVQDALSVGYLISQYDCCILKNVLDHLRPDNCRLMLMCNTHTESNLNRTEKWFDVKYSVNKINEKQMNDWSNCPISPDFHFPLKNEFICSELKVKPVLGPQICTSKIVDSELCRVWHLQESIIPKIFIRIEIFRQDSVDYSLPMVDPFNYAANHVLGMSIKESVAEELYSASLAGLYYTLNPTMYGLEITLDGFDEKMGLLAIRILEGISQVTQHLQLRFSSVKDSYSNGLKNSSSLSPSAQVPYYMSLLLREKRFSHSELLQATQDLTVEDVISYHALLTKKIKLEWLLYGNITEEEAVDIAGRSTDILREACGSQPLLPCQSLRQREIEIPKGRRYIFHAEVDNHTNSCCTVFLQVGVTSMMESVLLELIDQIIYQPCFERLRNKENLGYIVQTSVRKSGGTQGLLIVVQGNRDPAEVESRIEQFLTDMDEAIARISEKEFERHRESVSLRKCDIPTKLDRKGTRIWNEEIYSRQYNFNRIQEELEILKSIDIPAVHNFFRAHIHPEGPNRKTLILHLTPEGSPHQEATCFSVSSQKGGKNRCKGELITDVSLWKSKMHLYPAQ